MMNDSIIDADQSLTKILNVDDEKLIQKLLKKTMETAGFITFVASDGIEALALLTETFFDVVITDISMPNMDGKKLIQKIAEDFPTEVIVMTGQIAQYRYEEFVGIGAKDFVQKPLTSDEILLRVKRVLYERQLRENLLKSNEELAKSQKLESIGQLSSGIAHELNTPIQYIGDNTNFLKESFQDIRTCLDSYSNVFETLKDSNIDPSILETVESAKETADLDYLQEEIPSAIKQTLEGVNRIQKIVKAMKVFAHPGENVHVQANLNECIKSTITISKNEWKYVADLSLDLDSNLPLINCDPGELNQVFLNIIVNASHAISERLSSDSSQKGKIQISTRFYDNWVEVRISDNGTGIPKKLLNKVFDPFFTTKQIGKGSGQGLAISRSVIVDRHKGELDIETQEGTGATFIIKLPIEQSSKK